MLYTRENNMEGRWRATLPAPSTKASQSQSVLRSVTEVLTPLHPYVANHAFNAVIASVIC